METIQELLNNTLLSFVVTALFAPIVIMMLYKGGVVVKHVLMRNKINEEFVKLQRHKSGTPSMGGLIVVIPFVLLSLWLIPDTPLRNTFLVSFLLFSAYGFLEEAIVKANLKNKKFRLFQETFLWRMGKLLLLFGIGIFVAWFMNRNLGLDNIDFLGFEIPFGGLFLVFWGVAIIAGTYGAEITDGLDGLVTGLFLIGYFTYAVIIFFGGEVEMLPQLGLLIGPMMIYLYFNITPARVFMGGVGAIPLGFGLIFLALVTNTLLPFLIITSVFWVELLSSFSQILSIRFFGRKIFKIAPIHHHFEAIGWSESKIVERFWLAGLVSAVVGLWMYVSYLL